MILDDATSSVLEKVPKPNKWCPLKNIIHFTNRTFGWICKGFDVHTSNENSSSGPKKCKLPSEQALDCQDM